MVVGVTALRTMELWPHFVDYCVAKMNEDMATFTNELLEDFDEDSAPIH